MRPQVRGLGEGGRAALAGEGSLPGVRPPVDGQRGPVGEGQAADAALVRLVPRMHPLVDLQPPLGLAPDPAEVAGESLDVRVRGHVLLDVEAAEAAAADRAGEAPVLVLVVPGQVHAQVGGPAEGLPADGAHVRPLAAVHEAVVRGQHALVHEVRAAEGADVVPRPHVHLEVLRSGRLGLVRLAALLALPRVGGGGGSGGGGGGGVTAGLLSWIRGYGQGRGITKLL